MKYRNPEVVRVGTRGTHARPSFSGKTTPEAESEVGRGNSAPGAGPIPHCWHATMSRPAPSTTGNMPVNQRAVARTASIDLTIGAAACITSSRGDAEGSGRYLMMEAKGWQVICWGVVHGSVHSVDPFSLCVAASQIPKASLGFTFLHLQQGAVHSPTIVAAGSTKKTSNNKRTIPIRFIAFLLSTSSIGDPDKVRFFRAEGNGTALRDQASGMPFGSRFPGRGAWPYPNCPAVSSRNIWLSSGRRPTRSLQAKKGPGPAVLTGPGPKRRESGARRMAISSRSGKAMAKQLRTQRPCRAPSGYGRPAAG
jgi:hypothetical protein